MAQIEAWLWDRLNTDADVVEAIGEDKAWPIIVPQQTVEPYITFRRSSTNRQNTLRKSDTIPLATFEINCFDTNYSRLKTWTDIVRLLLDGCQERPDGFEIQRASIVGEADAPEPVSAGAELPNMFMTQFILEIRYRETVVTYT